MLSKSHFRFLTFATALLLVSSISLSAQDSSHRGRKYKPPPPTSKIEVTVVRDADSKPIENAAVVFHLDGDKGNMELKTNEDGKSTIDVLPMGSVMSLQVIAKGYQTFGKDYKIDKSEMSFPIRLKRPAPQYSIYEKHDQSSNDNKDGDAGTPKNPPDASKDKPADSPDQPSKPPSR